MTPSSSVRLPWLERLLQSLILLAVLLLVAFITIHAGIGMADTLDDDEPSPAAADDPASAALAEARAAADKADETASQLDLLLSFLEGVAVLVGLALGAAAYFGFRSTQDLREELRRSLQANTDLRDDIRSMERQVNERLLKIDDELEERFDPYRDDLQRLPDVMGALEKLRDDVQGAIRQVQPVFSGLLQASQELRLKNHAQAYEAALHVLELDPDNAQAHYIAGWLELQYIPGRLNAGVDRLKLLRDRYPDWAHARAAYGIGLRRKARDVSGSEQRNLFNMAEGELLAVLGETPHLLDLNLESFWGPVGGIRREMGRLGEAVDAYKQALRVTPFSSYPMGNLSSLLLEQASAAPAQAQEALRAFARTRESARAELAIQPNDYFHVMDIAMASTMLGQKDPTSFEAGGETLEIALGMDVTPEMLRVSLRGWQFLRTHCPADWTDVIAQLDQAIARMQQAINALDSERPD